MSSKDRAFVDKHITDLEAIRAYFASKEPPKPIPDWAKRLEERFWKTQPNITLALEFARQYRKVVEQGLGGAEAEALFIKWVTYCDLTYSLPLNDPATRQLKNRLIIMFGKLVRQSDDLQRKHKFEIKLELTNHLGAIEPLEAWEKVIPKR